jgi:Tfp pilus assembly protein PilF
MDFFNCYLLKTDAKTTNISQTKRDLQGAEEYYSRAILADPKDGEILSQYGKLVWELHQDQDRASSYFERGVQASPEDW